MELNQLQSLKSRVVRTMTTPTVLAILLMILFSVFTVSYWLNFPYNPFHSDVDQYYSYLVAQFIEHDFSFKFDHYYWLTDTPLHTKVPKVTMGMAILYFPFFVIGYVAANLFGYDVSGYSAPFAWSIHFGTFVYVFTGFWYMRKTLLLFFSEWVTAITLLLVLFATNLFYYAFRNGEMPHSYLFFLFSLFFYHTILWHHTKNIKHLYYLAFIAGLITLIRPTEIFVLIIPLFYQVTSMRGLLDKLRELGALKWKWFLFILLFLTPIIPQLLFWKEHTGQFLFFSYGSEEGFFFADPKFYSILFGWHKGWFLYTPLALVMVAGLVMMCFKWKKMAMPLVIYLVLTVYLISSWWDWGFGGAFGMRALVQSYAFLAVPLAFLIQQVFSISKHKLKVIVISLSCTICVFFTGLNMFQTWQTKHVFLHWDAMTRKAYSFIFFKVHFTPADIQHMETLLAHPNYEAMRKGDRDEK